VGTGGAGWRDHQFRARSVPPGADHPTFELKDGPGVNPANVGRKVPHGALLKVVTTNICGSDQHTVRGRTTAPEGLVLGHEITGEVIEVGPGVESVSSLEIRQLTR